LISWFLKFFPVVPPCAFVAGLLKSSRLRHGTLTPGEQWLYFSNLKYEQRRNGVENPEAARPRNRPVSNPDGKAEVYPRRPGEEQALPQIDQPSCRNGIPPHSQQIILKPQTHKPFMFMKMVL
jgi:hypothetical protein